MTYFTLHTLSILFRLRKAWIQICKTAGLRAQDHLQKFRRHSVSYWMGYSAHLGPVMTGEVTPQKKMKTRIKERIKVLFFLKIRRMKYIRWGETINRSSRKGLLSISSPHRWHPFSIILCKCDECNRTDFSDEENWKLYFYLETWFVSVELFNMSGGLMVKMWKGMIWNMTDLCLFVPWTCFWSYRH